jgi:hypothetical protein
VRPQRTAPPTKRTPFAAKLVLRGDRHRRDLKLKPFGVGIDVGDGPRPSPSARAPARSPPPLAVGLAAAPSMAAARRPQPAQPTATRRRRLEELAHQGDSNRADPASRCRLRRRVVVMVGRVTRIAHRMRPRVRHVVPPAAIAATALAMFGSGTVSRAVVGPAGARPVIGLRTPVAPRRDSFVSVFPACACGRRTVLEQFSLKNGRWLGALARLPGGLGVQLSDPHPGAGGSVWLTIGTGPRYRSGVAGGDPAPDSCSGRVIAFDPRTRTSSTVTSFGASELIADAIPSPDGRLMVMVGGGCASSYFNEHLIVRDRRTGRQWTLGDDAAPCHALTRHGALTAPSSCFRTDPQDFRRTRISFPAEPARNLD